MNKKNRETLKNYFKKGSLPSEQEFADLIDSVLNTIDDGFEKTEDEGLKISALGNSDKLAGFYRDIQKKSAIWSLEFGAPGDRLLFKGRQGTVLSLDHDGRVGINLEAPRTALDIGGVMACQGRMGTYPGKQKNGRVPADGKPHAILEGLDGCRAFEVVAGAGGGEKSGKYALTHAIALSTFKSQKEIEASQAWYGSRCNRIKLWWEGEQQDYALMIKTCCCFGEGSAIQYQITDLWFDPYMAESRLTP